MAGDGWADAGQPMEQSSAAQNIRSDWFPEKGKSAERSYLPYLRRL